MQDVGKQLDPQEQIHLTHSYRKAFIVKYLHQLVHYLGITSRKIAKTGIFPQVSQSILPILFLGVDAFNSIQFISHPSVNFPKPFQVSA
jgi:hypothetical protein